MAHVQVIAVDQDVVEKLDVFPVAQKLEGVDITVLYSCTNDKEWRSKEWSDNGQRTVLIKLPYKTVERLDKEKVSALMLERTQKRLGQVA